MCRAGCPSVPKPAPPALRSLNPLLPVSLSGFCVSQTSSIRVEAEGIGCSQYLDIWGDFPKTLQVSAASSVAQDHSSPYPHAVPAHGQPPAGGPSPTAEERRRDLSPRGGKSRERGIGGVPADGSSLESESGGPCLDLVAAMHEAPMPLLRPVLLLTLAPMYTITSHCTFPIRVRQARPGSCCCSDSSTRSGDADFMVELLPQQVRPLVWRRGEGSRALQLQG